MVFDKCYVDYQSVLYLFGYMLYDE